MDKLMVIQKPGVKIGICSLGDYAYLIPLYMGVLKGKDCDIAIVANSCKRIPYYVLEKLGDVTVLKKNKVSDEDKINILNEIMRVI